jgi:hypothetical protein
MATGTKQGRIDFARQRAAGERYYQLWKALQQRGVMPVVVSKAGHPALWWAWRDYYRSHGLWAILSIMDDGRTEKTVPTLDPADFEPVMFIEAGPDRRVKDD